MSGSRRKRNLKCSFAIIESTGTTHFVIVESDTEYYTWTQKILNAMDACSVKRKEHDMLDKDKGALQQIMDSPPRLNHAAEIGEKSESREASRHSSFDGQLHSLSPARPLGSSLSKAGKAAKAKGQAVID